MTSPSKFPVSDTAKKAALTVRRLQVGTACASLPDGHYLVQAFTRLEADALSRGRKEAIEEAAKVAEQGVTYVVGEQRDLCDRLAAAIRSLLIGSSIDG